MSIENLDDYILEFQKYKEGEYKFGNYQTVDHILYNNIISLNLFPFPTKFCKVLLFISLTN